MRLRRRALSALLTFCLVTGLGAPAMADSTTQRKKQVDAAIAQLKASLGETSAQLSAAIVALASAKASLAEAEAGVRSARAALAVAQARDDAMVAQLSAALADEARAQRQMDAINAKISSAQVTVDAIANAAYRSGGGDFGQLAVALQASSPQQFTDRIVLYQTAMQASDNIIRELQVSRADQRQAQATLAAQRARVAAMRAQSAALVRQKAALSRQAQAGEARVRELVTARQQAARDVAEQKAAEQSRLAQAIEQSKVLARQIAAEMARQEALRASRGGGRAFLPTGSLAWPAPGPISDGAGYRVNPFTGSPSCHAGVDIAAGYGAPIVAAASGVVVATVYTAWDGYTTVIDNGGGMTTWYAHQPGYLVHVGQWVARGQVIGRVGASGYATGPHLHFGVALSGVPYDPMGWFGGPRRTIQSMCPNGPEAVM